MRVWALGVILIACGDNAGINPAVDVGSDAGTDASVVEDADVGRDADVERDADVGRDAARDAETDTATDAGLDAGRDVGLSDAFEPDLLEPTHADEVIGDPTPGPGVSDPNNAANGIGGTLDVFSLGYDETNSSITLSWSDACALNGPGVDLVVFENGFVIGGGPGHFMDLVVVELSLDGERWVALPHDYVFTPETLYSNVPDSWVGFAGVWPVLYRSAVGGDPFDFPTAGGDAFDLDILPTEGLAGEIRENGFCFVRLVTAPSRVNPDTGEPFVRDGISNGADIDGVIARYLVASP